jgi:Na+-driven multidrug efflux pump
VAVSTVLSQAVIMVMCLFALGKKNFGRADKKYAWEILKASTSPLGINFVPSLVLFFTNLFALKIGAEAAVSAYGVMSYAVYTFEYFYQGVVDGVQPVLSYCQGTGDGENKKRALKTSLIVLGVSTAVFMLLTPLMIWGMPKIFSVSAQAADLMKTGFIVYAFAYPFKAVVKFICAYYYAVGETKISNLLIYADPIFFTPITLLVLSGLGMTGVWLSLTISQLCIAALGVLSLVKKNKKQIKEPTE